MNRFLLILSLTAFAHPTYSRTLQFCEEIESTDIYECLGATERGRKLFLAALEKEGKQNDKSFRELVPLSAQLNYNESIPVLKRLVTNAKNLPTGYSNYDGDLRIVQADLSAGTLALSEFSSGGVSSDPEIGSIIHNYIMLLEKDHVGGSGWDEALHALSKIGGPEATNYAAHLMDYALKTPADRSKFATLAAQLAVDSKSYSLIPNLRKFDTTNRTDFSAFEEAQIQGALMELGDKPMRKWFRDRLLPLIDANEKGSGIGITFPVVHPDLYLRGLGDLEDLKMFTYFELPGPEARDTRYAIIHLLDNPQLYPAAEYNAFKQKLLSGLKENTKSYEDQSRTTEDGERKGWQFSWGALVEHRYILFRLGDAASADKIREIAHSQKDPSTPGSWAAVGYGIELGLLGVGDSLASLVLSELAGNGDTKLWELRRDTLDTVAPKLGSSDARWSLLLFDSNPFVRDRALHHFSRIRPASACKIVTDFASKFEDPTGGDITGHALVALTVLGKTCVPDLVRIASSGKPLTRGIATEALTMLEVPEAKALRSIEPSDDLEKARVQSARNIAKFLGL